MYPGEQTDQCKKFKRCGNFDQLNVKMKSKYRHLKTMISIGGPGSRDDFLKVTQNDATINTFSDSCVAFMEKHKFDGIDISWEITASEN